jgi:hypothetical protein
MNFFRVPTKGIFQNRLQNYYKLFIYASFLAIIFYFVTFFRRLFAYIKKKH